MTASSAASARFQAYIRLQAAAVAFGEEVPIPEIVVIGGQSDGKSSLVEAFLGFRFNICKIDMATRRPLILQMVNDPDASEPTCQFQVRVLLLEFLSLAPRSSAGVFFERLIDSAGVSLRVAGGRLEAVREPHVGGRKHRRLYQAAH
jgi:hypothetical protein